MQRLYSIIISSEKKWRFSTIGIHPVKGYQAQAELSALLRL
jgi:hypothetical protein